MRLVRQPGIPLAGLEITVFPIDPDALLDSLATQARRPRPQFAGLDAEMAAFRGGGSPDTTGSTNALRAWDAARDSVEALGDTLRAMDRASLAYRETYGAVRYLEPVELPDGRFEVNFNLAYNPYCAYNENWSCPITPAENQLKAPIRAGEMVFEEHPD